VPAGEPAHQPVRFGECVGRVDIVEDQQPPGVGYEPGQHRGEAHLFLGRLAFGQLQRPREARQVASQTSGEAA